MIMILEKYDTKTGSAFKSTLRKTSGRFLIQCMSFEGPLQKLLKGTVQTGPDMMLHWVRYRKRSVSERESVHPHETFSGVVFFGRDQTETHTSWVPTAVFDSL